MNRNDMFNQISEGAEEMKYKKIVLFLKTDMERLILNDRLTNIQTSFRNSNMCVKASKFDPALTRMIKQVQNKLFSFRSEVNSNIEHKQNIKVHEHLTIISDRIIIAFKRLNSEIKNHDVFVDDPKGQKLINEMNDKLLNLKDKLDANAKKIREE
jgi:hypothetical protein